MPISPIHQVYVSLLKEMNSMPEDDIHGRCTICGHVGLFQRGNQRSLRESYPCPNCRFGLRWRDQAAIIIDEFGRGKALSIDDMMARGLLEETAIYEPALRGPFTKRFQRLPQYIRSYYRPGEPLGQTSADGVRIEDLRRLSFDEDSFDLIITSDVMEHLPEVEIAFAEILRVLRPGGIHVFSIPNDYPLQERSEPRVRLSSAGVEVHVKPPRYHNAGDGSPSLVYTDFGADLPDMVRSIGGRLSVVRRSIGQDPCHANATFVMRKLASAGARRPPSSPAPTAISAVQMPELECPICKGTSFEDFNGRQNARCSTCRAVERHRLMWMILERLGGFSEGKRVLHVAPELGLARKFMELSGSTYHAVDFDVARYNSQVMEVRPLDLCSDLPEIADASYDLILHSHVLEHVPCDVKGVLKELDRILAPGGLHFFSVPTRGEHTDEDLSADLSHAERLARFGQEDHMRIFGRSDLQSMLTEVWGDGPHLIEPIWLFARDDLRRAAIPTMAWQGVTGYSVFHYRKGDRPPAVELCTSKPPAPPAAPAQAAAVREKQSQAGRSSDDSSYPVEDAPGDISLLIGLTALRRDNPWPLFPEQNHPPFYLALDAGGDGGREIILRQLVERDVRLMVEVGCFLGGSSLQWLQAKSDLTVIGVDPWDGNWAAYITNMLTHPTMSRHAEHLADAEVKRISSLLRDYGNYAVALNNLRDYRDRFIPVRRFSPEALHYLHGRDIKLELIYIDAFKHRADLDVAYSLYPDAILCGDDWLWPDESGRFVMQDAIKDFAADHGFEIEAKRQSWVLHRRQL